MDKAKKGIIYILQNETVQGLIKIGFTNRDVQKRVKELCTTGVAAPFTIYYACEVYNAEKEEDWVHDIFADRRPRANKEWFDVSPERVVVALKKVALKDVTPKTLDNLSEKQQKKIEKGNNRRANFDFNKYDIPVGSELFFRDAEKTAVVYEDNKVKFDGKIMSHSEAARIMLGVDYRVNGCLYWQFDDEILDERRKRMDNKEKEDTLFDGLNK